MSEQRLDAWYDGSAICLIAVGSLGDPLDLGDDEVRALALITILPSVTWPSPPMATRLPRRTDRIVVPWYCSMK